MDMNSRSKTLGEQIELFNGITAQPEPTPASLSRQQWLSLAHNDVENLRFQTSLNISQLTSHRLLQEWLKGRSEDPEFDLDARDSEHTFNTEHQSQNESSSTSSSYHYHLAKLLYYEFSYPTEETPRDLYLALLHAARNDAAMYASCQRLAEGYYGTISCPTDEERPVDFQMSYVTPYGASVEPCAWLQLCGNDVKRHEEMPFYLWDIKGRRTATTNEIAMRTGALPEYAAISHTWGRWKIGDEKPVQLPNVPWEIPRNERFVVENLPTILEKLPFHYVWLDLLTIPQGDLLNDSTRELLNIQKAEIGRQATIFRSAEQVIAWFHDVQSWSGLSAVTRYLSLEFLTQSPARRINSNVLLPVVDSAASVAKMMPELLFKHVDNRMVHSVQIKPDPWFTSLWTLQETCLRPDLMLCTADWEFLKDPEGVPITLSDIVALTLSNAKSQLPLSSKPAGVQQLRRLLSQTGLTGLLQASQLSIITMGNERHCLERRAEAIMCAIGTTDWFGGVSDEEREQNLVIDLYPLPFVNEVRKKLGSAVFFSSTPIGWQFHYVLHKFCREKRTKRHIFEELGSLLPFGPGARSFEFEIRSIPHMLEHPSLASWVIENSGCVRIGLAGIVSCSNDNRGSMPLNCIIVAPSPEDNRLVTYRNMDLHSWIHTYKPESPNFAVCLLHSNLASRGILLRQMETGIFLKVGSYWQMESPQYDMPESKLVDWRVM